MMGLAYLPTASVFYQIKDEQHAFKLKCSLLKKKEADELRANHRQYMKEMKEHREKLEIANAGRARNLWGN